MGRSGSSRMLPPPKESPTPHRPAGPLAAALGKGPGHARLTPRDRLSPADPPRLPPDDAAKDELSFRQSKRVGEGGGAASERKAKDDVGSPAMGAKGG